MRFGFINFEVGDLPSDIYEDLLAALQEENPEWAETFANFFHQNGEVYTVNNLAAYTDWVKNVVGGEDDDDWFAWDDTVHGKSTQGGGVL
jgi:hypothetical protein